MKADCYNVIKMGAMIFSSDRNKGIKPRRNFGPCQIFSVRRDSTYDDLTKTAKNEFFPGENDSCSFHLATNEGLKISKDIDGHQWTLEEYLLRNSIYPSKFSAFCVMTPATKGKQLSIEEACIEETPANAAQQITAGTNIVPSENTKSESKSQKIKSVVEMLQVPFHSIKLLEQIGRGGYGVIFRGIFRGTICAVKRIDGSVVFHPYAEEELKALAKLRHPNIVCLMGYAKDESYHYLVTSYVSGGNLEELIFKNKEVVSGATMMSFSDQLASGLAYMHSQNVIHRDIKPANVLVDKGRAHIYICDMGIARLKQSVATLTQCLPEGTPSYISPETAIEKKYGQSSDIWAFGLIMIEMFTMERAWGELLSATDIAMQLVQKKMPVMLDGVEGSMKDLCKQCLSYDPKNRPSMMTIAEKLREMTVRGGQ